MAQYIDKSDLVAEIKTLKQKANDLYGCSQFDTAYNNVLKSIDTLEGKEVGLEKESLTWKDIGTIDQLLWDLSGEHSGKSDNEGYYKAVLSRFKAQKVE